MILNNIAIHFDKKSSLPTKEGGTAYSISALYLSCLGKYTTSETKKIVVQATIDATKQDLIDDLLDVVLVYKVFDFEKYMSVNKHDKRKMMLDVLQAGFLTVAKTKDWDVLSLENAYQCCLKKKLEHTWLREDRYIFSPDRRYYAGIICNWDSYIFEVFAVFLNKEKQEIKRKKLYESNPAFVEPIGKMMWDKDSTSKFTLFSKDGKQKWTASV